MKKLFIIILSLVFFLSSCDRVNDNPGLFPPGNGFFILNEGNFMSGNGSVSFYSIETGEIYNDLFKSKNKRALGDVPTFITADGSKGFIIVNNSGTIEVTDLLTMESITTITGLNSPRQMVIDKRKGYVSSLFSDEISIIDIDNLTVTGTINIGCSTETMVKAGRKLFVANWSGGNRVIVVDLDNDQVLGSLITGLEPESMVLDKNGMLWVLCTGGYLNEEVPRLVRINTLSLEIEDELLFSNVNDNPSSLTANSTGDTLYYLCGGIRRMSVTATELPSEPFVSGEGRLFYKLNASVYTGMICVTDAIDYQQKGDLLIYDARGVLADTEQAGIIPGFMFFMPDVSTF
jgi:hypothetical protein